MHHRGIVIDIFILYHICLTLNNFVRSDLAVFLVSAKTGTKIDFKALKVCNN